MIQGKCFNFYAERGLDQPRWKSYGPNRQLYCRRVGIFSDDMNGTDTAAELGGLGLVVIGRNEGERLVRCLASVRFVPHRVYVDSGSTDSSIENATREGVLVIKLEVPPNFTAARARNCGLAKLLADWPGLEFVQTVDGDCEIDKDWIRSGLAALRAEPGLAAVFGRLRERFPDHSVYNALCDEDWNVSIGETPMVGGNAMFRVSALRQANFFDPSMIAGEEPDLSMRMRKQGWRLRCIDAEMGFHDADIMRFSQWWKRTRRTGHAYAELAYRHPDARDPNWPRTVYSILFWGGLVPIVLIVALILSSESRSWWLLVGLVFFPWSLHILQISLRKMRAGSSVKLASASGTLLMIGKIAQLIGLAEYYRNRFLGRASRLIEHKRPAGT
jgi:glycosyltransferase involved in cell wall biosynthesis